MPSVKLDTIASARSIADHISRQIRIDFSSEGPKRKTLTYDFDQAIKEKVTQVVQEAVPLADAIAREGYSKALSTIAVSLLTGFPKGTFHDFTRHYYNQKKKWYAGTEDLFWVRSGGLGREFRKFAVRQQALLHGAHFTVRLTSSKYVFNKRRYRFTLTLSLPEITASLYRDVLFRRQFLSPEGSLDLPLSGSEPSKVFKRIPYNESPLRPANRRPFIQEEIRYHGVLTLERVAFELRHLLG